MGLLVKCLLAINLLFLPSLISSFPDPFDPTYQYNVYQVVNPTERFTKHWSFVIDGSHSIRQVTTAKLLAGLQVTQRPNDELSFSCFLFSHRSWYLHRDWHKATQLEFDRTIRWVKRNRTGVTSFASKALNAALTQNRDELTIILITDGGFTEGFEQIQNVIKAGQQWRINHGFNAALICTIGIENLNSSQSIQPYPKQTDKACQTFLKSLGTQGKAGYFNVKRERSSN